MLARARVGLPSLEIALRFLLGERSDLDLGEKKGASLGLGLDDEDDEDGDVTMRGILGTDSGNLTRNVNVPPPRRGGAIFGPQGELYFF